MTLLSLNTKLEITKTIILYTQKFEHTSISTNYNCLLRVFIFWNCCMIFFVFNTIKNIFLYVCDQTIIQQFISNKAAYLFLHKFIADKFLSTVAVATDKIKANFSE